MPVFLDQVEIVSRQPDIRKRGAGLVPLHHLGCALLVVVFVHLYGLYQQVSERLGSGFIIMAPLVLPGLFLALVFLARRRVFSDPSTGISIRYRPLLLGMACCLAALAIPDPEIAVKRIHVAEYLALSLYVRYTLAFHLRGPVLLVFSCLLSCLYGVHDELLQGLNPSRTYGLRDMLVNAVAAIGGCLVWHGLGLFAGPSPRPAAVEADQWSIFRIVFLVGLVGAVLAMAVPLIAQRNDILPTWPFMPLAAAVVVWSCFLADDPSTFRHGLLPAGVVAGLFLVYPLIGNGLQIFFY